MDLAGQRRRRAHARVLKNIKKYTYTRTPRNVSPSTLLFVGWAQYCERNSKFIRFTTKYLLYITYMNADITKTFHYPSEFRLTIA